MGELVRSRAIVATSAVLLSGCASIFEGTTQRISVNTAPAGARCTFWKNGSLVGDIGATPGSLVVRKSKDDLFIVCDKPGYDSATFVNKSGLAWATFANILTAGLAWAVDSSRGADNKYQGDVELTLAPAATPTPVPRATPVPEPVAPPRAGAPAPATAPPTPEALPVSRQIQCAASDGSRIRVTGAACPAGWTVAR
jgi:hypothetical protein